MRFSDFYMLAIVYCVSLFILPQPFLISFIGDGATTMTNIGVLLLMVTMIAIFHVQSGAFLINPKYLGAFAAAFAGIAINFVVFDPAIIHPEKYFAAMIFIGFSAIVSTVRLKDDAEIPSWIGVPAAAYLFFLSISQLAISGFGNVQRASLDDTVLANLNYMPVAAFLLAIHLHQNGHRFGTMLAAGAVVVLILLTQSRSGFLSVVGALVYVNLRGKKLSFAAGLRMLAVVALVFGLIDASNLGERFGTDVAQDVFQNTGRIFIVRSLFQSFVASPYFGAGFAVNPEIRFDPHNMFLEILLQGGLVGFILMAPILFIGIRSAFRVLKRSPLGFFASVSLVALLISGQFTGSLLLNLPFWLILGLSLAVEKNSYGHAR